MKEERWVIGEGGGVCVRHEVGRAEANARSLQPARCVHLQSLATLHPLEASALEGGV